MPVDSILYYLTNFLILVVACHHHYTVSVICGGGGSGGGAAVIPLSRSIFLDTLKIVILAYLFTYYYIDYCCKHEGYNNIIVSYYTF